MGTNHHQQHSHHPILSTKVAVTIGLTLFFMTAVTVWIAHVDLGKLNFVIAMAVATFKAFLVALFFMGLKYDRRENAMIFATSFLFLAIFMVLTSMDLFFRGDVYVKGPLVAAGSAGKSKLKKPWISTPELVAKGKEIFSQQCVSCHGVEGKGDGPAAVALTPHPRNFVSTEGWKNGRKPTMVFKTLKEGLPPSAMASYATLPADDRWALTHYVLSLAPNPLQDTSADFAKMNIDPTKDTAEASPEAATISVALAQERLTVPETTEGTKAHVFHRGLMQAGADSTTLSAGGKIYQVHCSECHGDRGEGGIKVRNLGVHPTAFVVTQGFKNSTESLHSVDSFSRLVLRGLPGELMPAKGSLSMSEMKDLYEFVQGLKR